MKINDLIMPHLNMDDVLSIEVEMRLSVEQKTLELYSMMAFHLGWVTAELQEETLPPNPRLHAQLALSVCSAFGVDSKRALRPAAAAELMSSFFEIHEDVQDGNTERRNHPAVWWTWGPAQAINAGNGMHSLACLKLYATDTDVASISKMVQALDTAVLERCEALFDETKHQEKLITSTDRYLEFAAGRSGALFGAAAILGMVSACNVKNSDSLSPLLGKFGRAIGAARQVSEDMRLMWAVEDVPPHSRTAQARAMNKKTNLPLAYTLAISPVKTKIRIGEIYTARVLSQESLKEVASLAEDIGAKQFCQDTFARLKEEAFTTIADVPELSSDGKTVLRETIEWLTSTV